MFNNEIILNIIETQNTDHEKDGIYLVNPNQKCLFNDIYLDCSKLNNDSIPSLYVLPKSLPSIKSLESDADKVKDSLKFKDHQRVDSINDALSEGLQLNSDSSKQGFRPLTIGKKLSKDLDKRPKPKRPIQPWEVFKAIEKKDLMFIMTCRDHSFELLLRKVGDCTPLVHAMRLGQEYDSVAIVLLGAMSRWVNNMDEDTLKSHSNRELLKSLRANLKIAIDHGLATGQTDLLASYLQTLVMSEGDKFINDATQTVSIALNNPKINKPVATATAELRKFATWRLDKNAETIATLDDYLSNGISDLVMMATWSQVLKFYQQGEPIPTYTFARDDRCYKCFQERISAASIVIRVSANSRLKSQISAIETVIGLRQLSLHERVTKLSKVLDHGIPLSKVLQ